MRDIQLITSRLITVPHGFPTRGGGVSTGAFESLNASTSGGDDPDAVAKNLERLAEAAHVEVSALRSVNQVHGVTVVEARRRGTEPATPIEADAVWTAEPGVAVGVKTADCLPILLEDAQGRRVAAVHAGWRGVIGGVLERTIEALMAQGSRPSELKVAIGPSIRSCCFEVDEALAARFASAFGEDVVVRHAGRAKPHLALGPCVRRAAERSGVPGAHVDEVPHCTFCDTRFFSHRREHGRTGRHLSFITCDFATHL